MTHELACALARLYFVHEAAELRCGKAACILHEAHCGHCCQGRVWV